MRAIAAVAVIACGSVRAHAQWRDAVGAHVVAATSKPPSSGVPRLFLPDDDTGPHPAPSWAPAASLVVPGAGQAAMRQTRGVAYIAAEAYAWVQALEFRREENRRRANYRRTAREVARAAFGAARDTSWEYYETLEERESSGRYNLTPNGPLSPETDTATYNGNQWFEIRKLRFNSPDEAVTPSDPRYQQALRDYSVRAVHDEFLWSWTNQNLQWDIYKADIARENQLHRDWTTTLIVIAANHLVSAIDALASVRLRESRGPIGERRIEATVPWPPFGRRRGGRP